MSLVRDRRRDGRDDDWPADPWDDPDDTAALVVERPRRAFLISKIAVYTAFCLLLVALLVAGAVGMWYLERVNPPGDPGRRVGFTVRETDTLETLSVRLKEGGFVTDAPLFRWYVERNGGLDVTPGYYELRQNDHMGNVLAVLRTPPSQTFTRVTFPEGFTIERMARRLGETVPRLRALDFQRAATNGEIRSRFQPAGVDTLEGLLFPDTYQISNSESEAQVVERMVALMERVGNQEDIDARAAELKLTPYQVLIIASMIEREAKTDEDRYKIARVIFNRLFLGMPLQIDATLYYQQDPATPFPVLRALDTPYNTYLYTGLPPTPIANPGRASIKAALNPVPNPPPGDPICRELPRGTPCLYLYYVVIDEEGRHAFAATLEQHEANIEKARAAGVL